MTALMDTGPRETALEKHGEVHGVAIAVVTQNKDDESQCRVKVRYPWHDKPRDSYWARLAMPMAGKDRGLVTLAELRDEVLVAFERNDIRFPHVLGSLYSQKNTSPFANDDGKNDKRIFKSRKKHYLLYDDGTKGVVELAHEKGRKLTLDDDGIVVQDGNGNKLTIDSNSGAVTIEATGSLTIKAATISIQSTGTLEIKASATVTVQGSLVSIN